MYFLDRNEFQFELPQNCLQILQESSSDLLTHYSRSFSNNSKSIITERLGLDFQIPEENILLGYGCEDLLMEILMYFIQNDDSVLIAQYAWWYYKQIVSILGSKCYEFPVHKNELSYCSDILEIQKLAHKHKPKVILIANPNNPTGDFIPVKDIEVLIQNCPDSILILDESYWGFHEQENSHLQHFLTNYPNVIILRTFSKYYGLPGVRIGYGIVNSIHSQLISTNRRYLGFNQLAEKIAIAALDSYSHYETINNTIRQEKQRFYEELRPLSGIQVYDSCTNFMLITASTAILPEIERLFSESKILVRYFTNSGLENHFRVSIAAPTVNSLVIKCIKEAASRI